jgi:hypothetical protein
MYQCFSFKTFYLLTDTSAQYVTKGDFRLPLGTAENCTLLGYNVVSSGDFHYSL